MKLLGDYLAPIVRDAKNRVHGKKPKKKKTRIRVTAASNGSRVPRPGKHGQYSFNFWGLPR